MEDEARAYFEAVEEHFLARMGRPLILSPLDVECVARWWEEGIPLEAVRRGIDAHLERLEADPRRRRRARAVRFCEEDVRDAWEDLRAARVGDRRGEGLEEPERVGRTLRRLGASLREAASASRDRGWSDLVARLEDAARELQGMEESCGEGPVDADPIEERLQEMDRALLAGLRERVPAEAEELREEAAHRLADVRERMEPEAFVTTREVLAERLLRERYRLARLSLYSY
jgi:hypothetical protein